MKPKTKLFLALLSGGFLLAVAEQAGWPVFYYSRLGSTTQVSDKIAAHAGERTWTVAVQQPVTRWLPFCKFGETVFTHTYWYADGPIERTATTRIRQVVIGFCSSERYDELARVPFVQVHESYLKPLRATSVSSGTP